MTAPILPPAEVEALRAEVETLRALAERDRTPPADAGTKGE